MHIEKKISSPSILRPLFFATLAMNMLTFSGLAQSTTIYQQPPLANGDGPASFYENESSDSFSLSLNTEITGIQWWGSFFDNTISTSNIFDIQFFNDNTGKPADNNFKSFNIEATRTTTSMIDTFGTPVFLFETDLTPFDTLANTPYYLSVVHPEDAVDDEFYWLQSDVSGEHFIRNTNAGVSNSWSVNPSLTGNLAFSLQGNQVTVPEPSPLVLLIMASSLYVFRRTIKA